MNKHSLQDRVEMLEDFIKCDENPVAAARKWTSRHRNRTKPGHQTYRNLMDKFRRTGSVLDDINSMKSKQKTSRTPEIIERAHEIVLANPGISTTDLGRDLKVSQPTAHRILRADLGLVPYKISTFQFLSQDNIVKRLEFASKMCQLIDEKKVKFRKLIFTDEAHFHLDGYVNRQNYRIWGTEKPEIRTKPLHPLRVTVWAGICAKGILGPIFIDGSQTINREVYKEILTKAMAEATEKGLIEGFYWQQDGAPPHRTTENLALVRQNYHGRVIAKGYPKKYAKGMDWPPFSPDLTPMDYYLWGRIKDFVYKEKPESLEELRNKIENSMKSIESNELERVMANFEKRLRLVIKAKGGHIESYVH